MNPQARLREAKDRLSAAAAACLRGEPGAAEEANAARAEVDALLAQERGNRAPADEGSAALHRKDRPRQVSYPQSHPRTR